MSRFATIVASQIASWCAVTGFYMLLCHFYFPHMGLPSDSRLMETLERCWFGSFGIWMGASAMRKEQP